MPSLAQMKNIRMMSILSDDMLNRILPLITEESYAAEQEIFCEGDPADAVYVLVKGKALLNKSASNSVCVAVSAVDPGDAFGWSAILGRCIYSATATCVEESLLWRMPGKALLDLLNEDPVMGHKVMEFLAQTLNERLEKRTTQLFKTLLEHIEMVCGLEGAN
ncbi:Crp/Fnr family transcriptional regulator [Desulfatibacillum aliphaticivorans]|uniref:Crp/Fnr family transcriptional regulator n=1 Tax=Desulfatibacillum aliphaticivorans TaxID=218208 RepID=UPI00042A84DB|nr:cyclic nucleotide-binding domain-containing protein [Desulfatibacillum aliphaticivorans]